ncbi:hypothetical protein EVAR_84565_1 [Eumeta japonica]|uniref:Uncharacterized protein n=1 Tax=Eumeta variegata TaxID=151549 RepID=A0A4C1UHV7_EUMVA|nr:hypothetical protein EVAR_84565_1 [Eumeta japonica]
MREHTDRHTKKTKKLNVWHSGTAANNAEKTITIQQDSICNYEAHAQTSKAREITGTGLNKVSQVRERAEAPNLVTRLTYIRTLPKRRTACLRRAGHAGHTKAIRVGGCGLRGGGENRDRWKRVYFFASVYTLNGLRLFASIAFTGTSVPTWTLDEYADRRRALASLGLAPGRTYLTPMGTITYTRSDVA